MMMRSRTFLCGSLLLALALLGCSGSSSNAVPPHNEGALAPSSAPASAMDEASTPAATPAAPTGAVLGHVEFQDHEVTIYSSAAGPRYTLVNEAGATVAQHLSEDQFAARFPELFRAFETANARLDASAPEAMRPVPGQTFRER